MRRIKDFFYDKNDILIVLIIVAAAAFIIYTRIDIIMAYPETIAQNSNQAEVQQMQDETDGTPAADAADDPQEDEDIGSNTTISITIDDSDTSMSVAERLAEAGLVSSAKKFEKYISKNGKAESILSGTFEIPSGSTDEEILNIITQ